VGLTICALLRSEPAWNVEDFIFCKPERPP
jgi:hypothetical protein